jgi:hypothetical protein
MNYFTRIGDRLVFRLINYGILLHGSFCIAAIGMVVAAPFVISDFMGDIKLTNGIMTEAQVVSVPLVNRSEERGDAQTGKFLYYVELPNSELRHEDSSIRIATPYLRTTPVGDLQSLQIFSHPGLADSSRLYPRIVEVPTERTWNSVFHALRGREISSAIVILVLQLVLAFVVTYVSIRGYFFIKNGARRRRH